MRYTGPVCKLCRREGEKLFLKGSRCMTAKCSIEKRNTPPGQLSGQMAKKLSEYGVRLRAKQRARRYYGMSEKQFSLFFERSARLKGVKSLNFLSNLERRLDSVVYRLSLAASHSQARQLVRHGHVLVNGKRVDLPSCVLKEGDNVEIAEGSKALIAKLPIDRSKRTVPAWLLLDLGKFQGRILRMPVREEIDVPVNEQYVVEYYSR